MLFKNWFVTNCFCGIDEYMPCKYLVIVRGMTLPQRIIRPHMYAHVYLCNTYVLINLALRIYSALKFHKPSFDD